MGNDMFAIGKLVKRGKEIGRFLASFFAKMARSFNFLLYNALRKCYLSCNLWLAKSGENGKKRGIEKPILAFLVLENFSFCYICKKNYQ